MRSVLDCAPERVRVEFNLQVAVLVLGAGPTGLGTATRLQQHGFDDWLIVDQVRSELHSSLSVVAVGSVGAPFRRPTYLGDATVRRKVTHSSL